MGIPSIKTIDVGPCNYININRGQTFKPTFLKHLSFHNNPG
jgi:hypothetical protein